MDLQELRQEAIKIIKANPELKSEIQDLFSLAISEVEEGGSESHECDLAYNDMIELQNEANNNKMVKGGKLTRPQQAKFDKVMSEWKAGKLHSGSSDGPIVTDQDQAIAIAYAQANGMKKMEFGGLVYDSLSDEAKDRMDGLVPTEQINNVLSNCRYIVSQMMEEGFELDEAISFIVYKIVDDFTDKRMGYFSDEYYPEDWKETGGSVEDDQIEEYAEAIYEDLRQEYKPYELQNMSMEEAMMSVDSYDEVPENLKEEVASYLMNMASQNEFFEEDEEYKDGGGVDDVSFSSRAVEKANLEQLFDMAKELGMSNYQNLNKEILRNTMLEHLKLTRFKGDEKGMKMLGNKYRKTEKVTNAYEKFKEYMVILNKSKSKYSRIMPYLNMNGVVISYKSESGKNIALITYMPVLELFTRKGSISPTVKNLLPKEVKSDLNSYTTNYFFDSDHLELADDIKILNSKGELIKEFKNNSSYKKMETGGKMSGWKHKMAEGGGVGEVIYQDKTIKVIKPFRGEPKEYKEFKVIANGETYYCDVFVNGTAPEKYENRLERVFRKLYPKIWKEYDEDYSYGGKMKTGGGVDKLPANLKKRLDKANSIIVKYNGKPISEAEAIRFNADQMPQSGYNGGLKAFRFSNAKGFENATKRDYQTIGDALIDISRKMSGKDIYADGGGVAGDQ